jgi:hypothetical protein
MKYAYDISGSVGGQTWSDNGVVEAPPTEFVVAISEAIGKAVYGKSGVFRRGPVTITKFTIEFIERALGEESAA